MEHSNCHPKGWSYCARVFYFNYARTDRSGPSGNTFYFDAWEREDNRASLVSGCEVTPLLSKEERDKFEIRRCKGVLVGYGPNGSINYVTMEGFRENRLRVHRTRDFQANRDSMPMRELNYSTTLESLQLDVFSDDLANATTYLDAKGILRCFECELVPTEATV